MRSNVLRGTLWCFHKVSWVSVRLMCRAVAQECAVGLLGLQYYLWSGKSCFCFEMHFDGMVCALR